MALAIILSILTIIFLGVMAIATVIGFIALIAGIITINKELK